MRTPTTQMALISLLGPLVTLYESRSVLVNPLPPHNSAQMFEASEDINVPSMSGLPLPILYPRNRGNCSLEVRDGMLTPLFPGT